MSHVADAILVDIQRSAAVVKFNRPAERNCLATQTLTTLESILKQLIQRSDIHSLIFTGSGDIFLSGADIRELNRLDQRGALQFARRGQQLFTAVASTKQLTVAAINATCMGGGLDFALACKFRVASPDSAFAHPGARLGIITGWGGTQRLPRVIGKTRALEFFMTGRRLNSTEALRIGLIDAIDSSPLEYALRISDKSSQARS